ncbi:MAG: hypothetical protein GWN84_22180, partial [Gammaproteobacteria bacterium]|nr:hypothetical protein [Gammaproteobacteria bacterium]NIR85354.1 hypothetical protein [Gammaproteobacteria bacterium]NIU06480.1 hypothetical protein [Gammaproteobacteria bacterium]NIX87753.1 hypothetical protein [Gammaproteobacteria bacterium]
MVGLRLPAVSFLTLVVGALACGDGDDVVNGITPTFDATITGDLDLTL